MISARGAAMHEVIFIECFAGEGALTRAVARAGFHVDPPQDVETGGTDFGCEEEVVQLWKTMGKLEDRRLQARFPHDTTMQHMFTCT